MVEKAMVNKADMASIRPCLRDETLRNASAMALPYREEKALFHSLWAEEAICSCQSAMAAEIT